MLAGSLSAYAERPTRGTIAARQQWGQLPVDLGEYDVFLAVYDCGLIGREATLLVGGRKFRGIIFDCSGDEQTTRWMQDSGIVPEVGHGFWDRYPHWIGSEAPALIMIHGDSRSGVGGRTIERIGGF